MTARARHDRGGRRIDLDADAWGIGASIPAVQLLASARPSSPRPASSGMPGQVRTTGEPAPASLPSRRARCTKRGTSASPTSYDGPHRERTATTPMLECPSVMERYGVIEPAEGMQVSGCQGSDRPLCTLPADYALTQRGNRMYDNDAPIVRLYRA